MLFDMIAPTPLIPGTRIYVDWAEIEESFLAAALITVIIEVPLFYFCGYRKPKELAGFAVVNIISNLLLNEFLEQDPLSEYWMAVVLGTPHSTLLTPQYLLRQLRQTISCILFFIQNNILNDFKLLLRDVTVCNFR